ncbi:MAG TPA: ribosomal-protein-alanine N-acetyltransferase [Clostridiales bacterium]|nr:ribosomal-protein-alanine N-acetyltransferase [Clostridiales bacterium]
MTAEHLADILTVEAESFPHPWTEKMFLEELSGKFSVYRAAVEDGRAVGYMGMWLLAGEGHITNIAVAKDFRCRGLGSALMDDFISLAEQQSLTLMTLEVRESNTGAIALYEKKGFEEVGRRKNYYDNTEDALIMTKYFSITEETKWRI